MEAVGPPSTAGRRLLPLSALRQNVSGSTRRGLKALSLVHCLRVAPGSPATRFDCWSLHAERRQHKGPCISQLMYNVMVYCGNKDGCDFMEDYYGCKENLAFFYISGTTCFVVSAQYQGHFNFFIWRELVLTLFLVIHYKSLF